MFTEVNSEEVKAWLESNHLKVQTFLLEMCWMTHLSLLAVPQPHNIYGDLQYKKQFPPTPPVSAVL